MSVLLAGGIFLISAIACQTPAPEPAPQPMPPDWAAELAPAVETFIEVWNTKAYELLDAVVSADFRRRAPDQSADGLAEMKEFMAQVHAAYPDFHIVIDESGYSENLGFILWTVTGTNTGEGAAPPTGKSIEISGITMLRFADGKITEEIVHYDTATMLAQLGAEAVPHAR